MTAAPASDAGWLDPFLADWRPGTGEPREIREPATRPAAAHPRPVHARGRRPGRRRRAKAAQPAWAATSYAERAAILRRAAEIYEAHRPEFGTWTQRETGAVHGKMHHEQNFAVGELHAAATMPFQPYGQLVPSVVPGRLSMTPARAGRRHRRDHARGTRRRVLGMRVVGAGARRSATR